MYRVKRVASTAARLVAVHNGHEGRVQLTDFRALDPKCTPVAETIKLIRNHARVG